MEIGEGILIDLNKPKDLQTESEFNEAMIESTLQLLEQVVGTLDLEEVLKRIVETAVFFSEADEGSLLLLDEETGELYMRAAKGFGDYYVSTYRQPIDDDSVAAQVMKTGRPVLITPDEKKPDQTKVETDLFPRSVLNLPIKRGDVTKGILAVYSTDSRRTFTHRHLLLLSPLAQYAGVAIENARRYQEAHQLLSEAYSLTDIAGLFTETRDLIELLYLIASQALGRLERADRVIIHLLDSTTGRLERKVRVPAQEDNPGPGRGFALGQGIAGQVMLEGGLVNIPNINGLVSFDKRDLSSGSLLVAPISRRMLCLGTISVASPVEAAFKNQEERFLMSLANLAAMAIENARIFGEERARAAQLEGVAQLAEKLISILDLDELLDQTVILVHERFGFEDVAIKLFDPQVDGLVFKVAAGLHADNFDPKSVQKLGEGMVGWAAQTGKTVRSNDH
jgi:GAF domain-containing protein